MLFENIIKLSFKERMIRLVIIWTIIMITLFSLNYFRKVYVIRNVPVYEQVFNQQCDFSILKSGDKINYDGGLRKIENINYWSYKNVLEIDFE